MSEAALSMLYALVLESGREWGEVATDFQKEDAEAVFSDVPPHWHFLTRARGGSKSTDIAGMSLAWLTQDAPPLAGARVVASSSEQAAIIIDAARGFVYRTPGLEDKVVLENERIIGSNHAFIRVLPQSASGSWGLRDTHLIVADEFCQWPETRGAKSVWAALMSAAPKVKGCKLIVLSSAGEPSHWSRAELDKCEADPMWNVHEVPGPVPWLGEDELASLRWRFPPSQYARLVLNEWAQDEDTGLTEEDIDAASLPGIVSVSEIGMNRYGTGATGYTLGPPISGVKYIITVDVGVTNDATVMVIAHREPMEGKSRLGPQRVVVDHIERWKGSKKTPIQITDVENWVVAASQVWNRAPVHADPNQFVQGLQGLNLRGVRAKEFLFSATSVGLVASSLISVFRNRQIHVPGNGILKTELLKLRLRSSTPGVTRLDHAAGAHDDQGVCIGMAASLLLGNGIGLGSAWIEHLKKKLEAQSLEPPKPEPRPRAYFIGEEAPTTSPSTRQCPGHRYFGPESRCVNCHATPQEVAQRAESALVG